jgi:alkanesulfonate monooxygenase SsuD/methylene tetrahydromethanopterin reductase-like flavin-dependent oxidoreductase (luciferase family)
MVAVSILIEGVFGLTWSAWKQVVTAVEQLGFAGLFLSDHVLLDRSSPQPSLELIVALTYLADHTERIHFGPMVSPLSVREPVTLARQAVALDELSDGRMILGVGAGWNVAEHEMFGYTLGDIPTRMARFEEGLDVITRLLRSDDPVTYDGRFFQLHDARILPRSHDPGRPPILIGGSGPRRTLPLVARYADIWNAQLVRPEALHERSAQLDQLLLGMGRQPTDVKRTVAVPILVGRTEAELERSFRGLRRFGPFADMSLNDLRSTFEHAIVGTPEHVIAQIRAYAAVGVEEVMVNWFVPEDIDGLKHFAEQILPYVVD